MATEKPTETNLDERTLELQQIVRHWLVWSNHLFLRECEDLKQLKKAGSRDYLVKRKALAERWAIREDGLYFGIDAEPDPVASFREENPWLVTLQVDLRYPRKRVMERIGLVIDRLYHDRKDKPPALPERLSSKKVRKNIEDYYKWFSVWDLRQDGKEWSQIKEQLGLNSIQNAKDAYKRTEKLIKEGLPGFPPFPQEQTPT